MISRDAKTVLLLTLLRAGGEPMTEDALKMALLNSFRHIAFTAGDLNQFLAECEADHFIAGTSDEILGRMWSLTPKGKIRAQQLA